MKNQCFSFHQWKPVALALSFLFLLASCGQVTIRVDKIPANTPPGTPIYVAGNFNYWDPGDPKYQLKMNADSTYYVTLPRGYGKLEYVFTRGDWTTVEKDECGYEIASRVVYTDGGDDIMNTIASWDDLTPLDCSNVTIVLTDIPENTPVGEKLLVAGSFNNWNPTDSAYELKTDKAGRPMVTIPKVGDDNTYEFKITRGSLEECEADEFGHEIPNRYFRYGEKDTLFVAVEAWEDLSEKKENEVTIVVKGIPENTPEGDDIYVVGDFNGWYPRDKGMVLRRNIKGELYVKVPRKGDKIQFKFTRGDWKKVEVDRYGSDVENRPYKFGDSDTIYTYVEDWKDLVVPKKDEVTFVVESLPEATPEYADLYFASNINNWNPGSRKWQLTKNDRGQYEITIPRPKGKIEYKITRGSWKSVEVGRNGKPIANRSFRYQGNNVIRIKVANWEDIAKNKLNTVTITLTSIPGKTPPNDKIYIAGNFNEWNPGDERYVLKKNRYGQFYITIPRKSPVIQFKFTRGNWKTVEANAKGKDITDRRFRFGNTDKINLKVVRWLDIKE